MSSVQRVTEQNKAGYVLSDGRHFRPAHNFVASENYQRFEHQLSKTAFDVTFNDDGLPILVEAFRYDYTQPDFKTLRRIFTAVYGLSDKYFIENSASIVTQEFDIDLNRETTELRV